MATKKTDSVKILEEFMRLASKEIDVVARSVQFEPAAQATAVKIIQGLSTAAKKSTSDFAKEIKRLPKKDREELLSAWEESGAVDAANLLIPLLRMGHATDLCFLLHEAAKLAAFSATLADIWKWGYPPPSPSWFVENNVRTALESLAYALDAAAQWCDQSAAEIAEAALNDAEQAIKRLEQKIDFIMDLSPGVAVPSVPAPQIPTSLTMLRKLLEVTKKFYKFEGFFTPTFTKDKQLIRIGPLATSTLPSAPVPILVTGLIDLSGMQNHDVVTITTKVLEPTPSPQYVIWRVKTFTGPQSSGIKHFQDFADLLEVPADGVEVLIAQSASSHNFDPAFLLTIPYQFLVETTVLPDFNVS